MSFDPWSDVPTTDKEVNIVLSAYSEGIAADLKGIYRCRRAMGESVLEAYQATLEAHLEAIEKANPKSKEQLESEE